MGLKPIKDRLKHTSETMFASGENDIFVFSSNDIRYRIKIWYQIKYQIWFQICFQIWYQIWYQLWY